MEKFVYWLGFLTYCFLVIFIGWRGYRRLRHVDDADMDFWAAGKSLSSGAVGLSISASFMSISWSCVYTVQLFYWYGLSALWLVPIPWLLTMAGFYFLAPHFRRLHAFSQPEMVARRFGPENRKLIAVPVAFVFLVWAGAEIYAAARVLAPILDTSFVVALAIVAGVVSVYSYLGGFSAVVTTDRVQFALVAFFILAITGLALKGVFSQYTFSEAAAQLVPPPKNLEADALSLWAVSPALIFMTLVAYLPGWLVETDIWLRIQAARDLTAARRGVIIAAINSLIFLAILPAVIALSSYVLYPPLHGVIPSALEDGAAIFAVLMQDHAPVALNIVLTIGLAAAAMSTIDTCANVVALSLSYDILEPWLRRRRASLSPQVFARWMSAAAVLLAFVYALFTESLWDIFYLSSGILTTTVFLPVAAVFLQDASAAQVKSAAVTGFLATFFFYTLERQGISPLWEPAWLSATGLGYILWAFIAGGVAFVLAGWFTPKRSVSA